MPHTLAHIVNFFRTGYPQGIPPNGYLPALALLTRRLTDEEVTAVAAELSSSGIKRIQETDIRVAITEITNDMPSESDTARVKARLHTSGCHLSDRIQLESK